MRDARSRTASVKPTQRTNPKSSPLSAWISRADFRIGLVLLVATFAVYSSVGYFSFLKYDDNSDVTDNLHVRGGITPEGITWAFTSGQDSNWIPLVRLSHMLDCQLFGLQSGPHHLTSLLFHALATLLLFAFLNRATRALWRSAFVAFLFALHPLHVESVAWVAERKDVLSAFFWFLTLWTYLSYVERPTKGSYAIVLAAFCLGLMSKPMVVTLPFVLLLLDAWPLRRLSLAAVGESDRKPRIRPISWKKALWEKVPFFALSIAAAAATYLVQKSGGAVKELSSYPVGLRFENAFVSFILYLAKMFWPTKLAVFYPYPTDLHIWQAALAGLAILGVCVLFLRWFRKFPYLAVGWFWYLGTLVPVIGLVQVGGQARADRYTYIPMVGISIIVAWGVADVLARWPKAKPAVLALAATVCCVLAAVTWIQIQYWRDTESLFQHALDVTDRNYVVHMNLGTYFVDVPGRLPDAINHLETAVQIKPDFVFAQNGLGAALTKTPDRVPEAIAHLQEALRIQPDFASAENNLGLALLKIPGRLPDAITHFKKALLLDPGYFEAHNDLAAALLRMPGRLPEAITEYETALRIRPDSAEVHYNLGVALSYVPARTPEAISHLETALRINPDYETHYYLGLALSRMPDRLPEAISQFQGAVQMNPGSVEARYNLGLLLLRVPGRGSEALKQFEAALRIRPDLPAVRQMVDRLRAAQPPAAQ